MPQEMDGIEMRDFAVETPKDDRADTQAPSAPSQRISPTSFWAKHVRLAIEEEECRDHLALERTFLAYARTASAYAQLGVTMAQLFRLNVTTSGKTTPATLRVGKALGATTEGIAILVSILGAAYFAKQQSGLVKGVIVSRGYEIVVMVGVSFCVSFSCGGECRPRLRW